MNGPVEVKIQNELVDKAYVSVMFKSLSGQSGKSYSAINLVRSKNILILKRY